MSIFNHYEILGVPYDATEEQITNAYIEKMQVGLPGMDEKYKTAYYILMNDRRRSKYDKRIGIHKYKKVSVLVRLLKGIARVILTLLDALFSFYWCTRRDLNPHSLRIRS